MKKNILGTLLMWVALATTAFAQQQGISGRVVSAETDQPIVGANIRVDDKATASATTNANGEFRLNNIAAGEHSLKVTHVSYATKTVKARTGEQRVIIKLEESNNKMDQVVVTGTGTHHRLSDAVIPVQVFTAQDLAGTAQVDLAAALQKLCPSLSDMTNAMGTTLSLNGLKDDYFIFLENGKRLYGDDTYHRIDMSRVKRVEVLSGAASALYGSEAIGGVINIITDEPKNSLNLVSNTKVQTHGQINESVSADYNNGKFGTYTSYRHQQSDGWQLSIYADEDYSDESTTMKQAATAFNKETFNQKFTYEANDALSLYALGKYYKYVTNRPPSEYNYNLDHETFGWGAGAQYALGKGNYIALDWNADYYTSRYDYMLATGSYVAGQSVVRETNINHDINLKGVFNLGKYNKLSAGVQLLTDELKSETNNIEKETVTTYALYAQDEIKILKSLQALVGVRLLDHENFGTHAVPNVALMYKVGGFNFRANYSTAYAAPTLAHQYAHTVSSNRLTQGNPDLKPETSQFMSFNAEYSNRFINVSAQVYKNKLKDMISYGTYSTDADLVSYYSTLYDTTFKSVRVYSNIDEAEVVGYTLNANANLGAGFNLSVSYAHVDTKGEEAEDEDGNTYRQPIDKAVKNAWTINGAWAHNWKNYRLHVSINGRVNSKRWSSSYGYAPSYDLWDLNTRHAFNCRQVVVEPGVGIENIFNYRDDRYYNSNYATLTPGRTYYVSLAIRFKN